MRKTLPSRRRDYTGGLIVSLSLIIVMSVFDLPRLESLVILFTIVVISVTMREMTQLFQNEKSE